MNRRRADAVAGLVLATVLVVGGALSWEAYQQQQAFGRMGGSMMDGMGAVHGPNPLWFVLRTLLVTAVGGGLYLVVRYDLVTDDGRDPARSERQSSPDRDATDSSIAEPESNGTIDPAAQPRARVLDLLPEDERRILEPIITSPGITQIELRDRSDFSKSKVSQTVSDLEKRGLLYRERQGRTYRVYPSDELRENRVIDSR